jgi:hypothetical protein
MRLFFAAVFALLSVTAYSSELGRYMSSFRQHGAADYAVENSALERVSLSQCAAELKPYCADTLLAVRQKAYYLVYKKGTATAEKRNDAVQLLLRGLNDANSGVVGQAVGYLQSFSIADFEQDDKELINSKLSNVQTPHFKELVLLAGYLNTGKDVLFRHWLSSELSQKNRWSIALALARMGSSEHIRFCLNQASRAPVNSSFVSYLLPDLIYTRQREAIDFCLNIIKSDSKDCTSSNPDISAQILCGYRVMELLAPIIVDFPVRVDVSGSLSVGYDDALAKVRRWIDEGKDYELNRNVF